MTLFFFPEFCVPVVKLKVVAPLKDLNIFPPESALGTDLNTDEHWTEHSH